MSTPAAFCAIATVMDPQLVQLSRWLEEIPTCMYHTVGYGPLRAYGWALLFSRV